MADQRPRASRAAVGTHILQLNHKADDLVDAAYELCNLFGPPRPGYPLPPRVRHPVIDMPTSSSASASAPSRAPAAPSAAAAPFDTSSTSPQFSMILQWINLVRTAPEETLTAFLPVIEKVHQAIYAPPARHQGLALGQGAKASASASFGSGTSSGSGQSPLRHKVPRLTSGSSMNVLDDVPGASNDLDDDMFEELDFAGGNGASASLGDIPPLDAGTDAADENALDDMSDLADNDDDDDDDDKALTAPITSPSAYLRKPVHGQGQQQLLQTPVRGSATPPPMSTGSSPATSTGSGTSPYKGTQDDTADPFVGTKGVQFVEGRWVGGVTDDTVDALFDLEDFDDAPLHATALFDGGKNSSATTSGSATAAGGSPTVGRGAQIRQKGSLIHINAAPDDFENAAIIANQVERLASVPTLVVTGAAGAGGAGDDDETVRALEAVDDAGWADDAADEADDEDGAGKTGKGTVTHLRPFVPVPGRPSGLRPRGTMATTAVVSHRPLTMGADDSIADFGESLARIADTHCVPAADPVSHLLGAGPDHDDLMEFNETDDVVVVDGGDHHRPPSAAAAVAAAAAGGSGGIRGAGRSSQRSGSGSGSGLGPNGAYPANIDHIDPTTMSASGTNVGPASQQISDAGSDSFSWSETQQMTPARSRQRRSVGPSSRSTAAAAAAATASVSAATAEDVAPRLHLGDNDATGLLDALGDSDEDDPFALMRLRGPNPAAALLNPALVRGRVSQSASASPSSAESSTLVGTGTIFADCKGATDLTLAGTGAKREIFEFGALPRSSGLRAMGVSVAPRPWPAFVAAVAAASDAHSALVPQSSAAALSLSSPSTTAVIVEAHPDEDAPPEGALDPRTGEPVAPCTRVDPKDVPSSVFIDSIIIAAHMGAAKVGGVISDAALSLVNRTNAKRPNVPKQEARLAALEAFTAGLSPRWRTDVAGKTALGRNGRLGGDVEFAHPQAAVPDEKIAAGRELWESLCGSTARAADTPLQLPSISVEARRVLQTLLPYACAVDAAAYFIQRWVAAGALPSLSATSTRRALFVTCIAPHTEGLPRFQVANMSASEAWERISETITAPTNERAAAIAASGLLRAPGSSQAFAVGPDVAKSVGVRVLCGFPAVQRLYSAQSGPAEALFGFAWAVTTAFHDVGDIAAAQTLSSRCVTSEIPDEEVDLVAAVAAVDASGPIADIENRLTSFLSLFSLLSTGVAFGDSPAPGDTGRYHTRRRGQARRQWELTPEGKIPFPEILLPPGVAATARNAIERVTQPRDDKVSPEDRTVTAALAALFTALEGIGSAEEFARATVRISTKDVLPASCGCSVIELTPEARAKNLKAAETAVGDICTTLGVAQEDVAVRLWRDL